MSDWLAPLMRSPVVARGDSLELTPLTANSLDAVVALERSAHSHPWSRTLLGDAINGRQRGLVASRKGDPVAHLVLCRAVETLELLNIAVAPAYRRCGYAQALLARVIDAMTGQFESLFLEVRESNHPAIALYRRLGFEIVGQRPGYYPTEQGREGALLLSRTLA